VQSLEIVHSKLQASFVKLKTDKEKAFELMRSEMDRWEQNENHYRHLLAENETLAHHQHRPTGERSTLSRLALEEAFIARARSSMTSDRADSITSSIHTGGSDVFYDATEEDGVLTTNMSSTDLSDLEGEGFEDHDDYSSDEDEFVDGQAHSPDPAPSKPRSVLEEGPIVRRSTLPAPVSGEDISLLSILRKNVGKDLSTVAMPVSLNEPINVLQRLCEELEYSELLDTAANLPDSLERMVYVAAFAVSGYASSQWRAGRKPFNPLHGETFEYICPEKGFKFISEKVSHYPPVMACHAESTHNWSFSMDSRAKTKFWGKSMVCLSASLFSLWIFFCKNIDLFLMAFP